MRRLVATSLVIACAGLTAGCGLLEADAESLPELGTLQTFKGKGYRIKLPCIPSESKDSVPIQGGPALTLRSWMCEDDDSAFGVATMSTPRTVQLNFDGAAQGAADAVGGTVVANAKVRYAGSPGRDVRIESTLEGEPATMFLRLLVRERVTYQVQAVVTGKHTKPPALYRKILRSLSFR